MAVFRRNLRLLLAGHQKRGLFFATLLQLWLFLLQLNLNFAGLFEAGFRLALAEERVKNLTFKFLVILLELHLNFRGSLSLNLLEKKFLAPVDAVQLLFLWEQDSVEALWPV